MAEIIEINDIINGSVINDEWSGTGAFDVLMNAANNNLNLQHESGRITDAEYGTSYVALMSSVMNISIDFILKKRLTELQLEGIIKDNILKDKQMLDVEKGIELKTQQIASMVIEDAIKQEQNTKDLEVKTQQIAGMVKEDLVKDNQIIDIMKGVEVKAQQIISMVKEDAIKEAQNTKDIELKDKQIIDVAKGTDLKDSQIISMGIEDTIKQSQNAKELILKDKQAIELDKSSEVKAQQIISMVKEDAIKEAQNTKDIELKDKQIQSEYISIIAKDKEAVKLGMDKAFLNNNASLKDVYTPIYNEVI